ncbi:oxygenase [Candidatus Tenderia electrophaga]|jgi:NAD(P)H-flavin reductase/ferredoxin|uniref:Oxygenase n=1 Tax=Candidatus Tenderia electrophaga TaxID=1748243 RepID=A0A0S2TBE7_9GAMM|nr:oxygenase [Candidatus Tenderia electrophaga]
MPNITYAEHTYACRSDESVLECLARHGVELSSSCRAGVCQTCMVKATSGAPPSEAQKGLKPQLQQQGYFLACICTPAEDLTVGAADEADLPRSDATVMDKTPFNETIVRLRLKPESAFDYRPGQFINLHRDDGLIRSYSIASLPRDGYLELHVEHIAGGRMSAWIRNELAAGETLQIDGPHGDCFYIDSAPEQNLLLIGTGSGLAPLYGIVRDALAHGHRGQIHLFHGGRERGKLYLIDELKQLAEQHDNMFYTPCLSGPDNHGFAAGRANELALQQFPKLDGWRVYLCGHPEMVNNTKKKAFLAGANFDQIHADPFTFSEAGAPA